MAHARLRTHEHFTLECGVEISGHVLRHLNVLNLIVAHRNELRFVNQNVRRHQQRIIKQAHGGFQPLRDFVLVAVRAFKQAHAGDAGEQPRQFLNFRHVTLPEEHGLRRIESQRQIIHRHAADIIAQARAVVHRRQGVKIGDEIKAFVVAFLQSNVLLDRAKIIPEMKFSGRLHAGQNAFGHRGSFDAFLICFSRRERRAL